MTSGKVCAKESTTHNNLHMQPNLSSVVVEDIRDVLTSLFIDTNIFYIHCIIPYLIQLI